MQRQRGTGPKVYPAGIATTHATTRTQVDTTLDLWTRLLFPSLRVIIVVSFCVSRSIKNQFIKEWSIQLYKHLSCLRRNLNSKSLIKLSIN